MSEVKKVPQIIFYSASFLVVLFIGNVFDDAFWQAHFSVEKLLNGKPLPAISQFFITRHHLPGHLMLLPWLALVGGPFLTRNAAKNYWDFQAFVLRYLAFLSCELMLFLILKTALTLPFISFYEVDEPPPYSATESVVRLFFWSAFLAIVFAAFRRAHQFRNGPKS